MDYEIKIKINNYTEDIDLIMDVINNDLKKWIDNDFDYSIKYKEVKPIVKQQKVIDTKYITVAKYLNQKNNEKYNNDKQWDGNKINLSAEQFRLLLNNDKIQYNGKDLSITDCYDLIEYALQKNKLFVIQSGQSFRKKIESIIANKYNDDNRLSNNKQAFMMPKKNRNHF